MFMLLLWLIIINKVYNYNKNNVSSLNHQQQNIKNHHFTIHRWRVTYSYDPDDNLIFGNRKKSEGKIQKGGWWGEMALLLWARNALVSDAKLQDICAKCISQTPQNITAVQSVRVSLTLWNEFKVHNSETVKELPACSWLHNWWALFSVETAGLTITKTAVQSLVRMCNKTQILVMLGPMLKILTNSNMVLFVLASQAIAT